LHALGVGGSDKVGMVASCNLDLTTIHTLHWKLSVLVALMFISDIDMGVKEVIHPMV